MSLEFQAKSEEWYATQPDRVCPRCRVKRSAREFGFWGEDFPEWVWSDENLPMPRKTCKSCLEAMLDPCCLCHKKKPFHWEFDGYRLLIPLTQQRINLYCKDCEPAFLALPVFRQKMLIHACSNRTFPPGQVVYGEKDPRTQEIRYIGRTANATRRHAEHMRNTEAFEGGFYQGIRGELIPVPYTRKHWMHDLKQLGLKPIQIHLPWSDIPAQVVEWEQRHIWHAIQQDWPITNRESIIDELIRKVKDSGLDFLKAPFEQLVECGFFREKGIEAFVRAWYEP